MRVVLLLISLLFAASSGVVALLADPSAYNVEWTTPSENELGSMPLGNGDVSTNVWVDATTGELLFYVAKTDAFDENAQLLKLIRVRVLSDPPLFTPPLNTFSQSLDLNTGSVRVTASRNCGQDQQQQQQQCLSTTVRAWVDANRPVVRVELDTSLPVTLHARAEMWRTTTRPVPSNWQGAYYCEPKYIEPDTLLAEADDVMFYHRNNATRSLWPESLRHQQLYDTMRSAPDPLANRTFGGMLHVSASDVRHQQQQQQQLQQRRSALKHHRHGSGHTRPQHHDRDTTNGHASVGDVTPSTHHVVSVYALTQQTDSGAEYVSALRAVREQCDKTSIAEARAQHEQWWAEFWGRSFVDVSTTQSEKRKHHTGKNTNGDANADDAFLVSRQYALQRFTDACTGRGASPIKFNGEGFTVNVTANEGAGPDFRKWGGGFWFQNTRLPYFPMLAAGDYDMLIAMFAFYAQFTPLANTRSQVYYGHDGVWWPETSTMLGLFADGEFGFGCGSKKDPYLPQNTYMRYHREGALEFATLVLDVYTHVGGTAGATLIKDLMPTLDGVLKYYWNHFPNRDSDNKTVIFPSQSLETWQCPDLDHCVTNPMPEVAGLRSVLPRLLELPNDLTTPEQRAQWQAQLAAVPPIPKSLLGMLSPGEKLTDGKTSNSENCELYAVHPYRLYGYGRPDWTAAASAFELRRFPCNDGWCQDVMDAALLGLRDKAKELVVQRARSAPAKGWRFPAFVGPYQDDSPNSEHINNMRTALQAMLLQEMPRSSALHIKPQENVTTRRGAASSDAIVLFAGWPSGWDVSFRLHASKNTTVECTCRGDHVESLVVTPESRSGDVVLEGCKN